MTIENEDAFAAAVNAGIDSVGAEDAPAMDEEVEAAEETTPEAAVETSAPEEKEVSAKQEVAAEAAPATKPGDKAKPAEGAKPGEAAKPADAAKAADPAGKPKDAINDPIDARLKPETKARIESLVSTAKDLTAQLNTARADLNDLVASIQETRSSPEQYGQALDYLRMVNSGNPAELRKCLDFMQREVQALAMQLGVAAPGVDFLAEHADLQEKVRDGALSDEDAREIAAGRARAKFETASGDAAARASQQQAAVATQRRAGADALNAWERETAGKDPSFAAKRETLKVELTKQLPNFQPNQWASVAAMIYKSLAAPAPVPAPATRPVSGQNQPLRANNPAGGTTAAPKSLEDAIFGGILAGSSASARQKLGG